MTEQKINLSTATAEELAHLPGIGARLARRIIAYRDAVRPFEEPGDVTAVPGISEKIYQAIADRLTVEEPEVMEPTAEEDEGEEVEDVVAAPEPTPVERALVKIAQPEPEPKTEPTPPPPPPPPRPTPTTSPAWLSGCTGLIAAALLGGLLGALVALLVIGGINGTLDFGQAEAVITTQAEMYRLSIQADTLQADLDGLRQRLEDLEGLTGRMDGVEQAIGELDAALAQTQADIDALNARADQLDEDVSAVRAAADRFDTFLDGLRDLLFEFQGAPPTPTSTPTSPPTTTPRPTRTPRPTPTGTP